MPGYSTEAIVLHAGDFQESDRLVTFFTRDFGKVRGIAKGAKKSKKRFGGNLEPFSHVDLRFFEKRTLDLVRIEGADFVQPFDRIRNDLYRIAYGCYLLELVLEMTAERQISKRLFELLLHFLKWFNETPPSEGCLRAFEIRLLSLLGYMPVLDRCASCEAAINGEGLIGFHVGQGGLLCSSCLPGHRGSIEISLGTAKTLRLFQEIDLDKLHRLALSRKGLKESRKIMIPFIHYRLDREIRSLKFLASIERD
jgi:DNA repair protein RecO (recombination protein O)